MSAAAPDPTPEPTLALVREALDEGRELIKLEIALARKEAEAELALARRAAIGWAIAAFAVCTGASMALVAIAIATALPLLFTVIAAIVLFVVGGVVAIAAYRQTPREFLTRTRRRLEDDVHQLGGQREWRTARTTR
jgi:hypothetical protein